MKTSDDANESTDEYELTQTVQQYPPTPPFNTKAWGRLYSQTANFPHIELVDSRILLGRKKLCAVQYSDPRVSGVHCSIQRTYEVSSPQSEAQRQNSSENSSRRSRVTGDIIITNLSTNGIIINGKKLGKGNSHLLKDADQINLLPLPPKESILYEFQRVDANSLAPNEDVQSHYLISDTIGTGSFSVVRLGIDRVTSERVAIKFIDKKKYWHNPKNETTN